MHLEMRPLIGWCLTPFLAVVSVGAAGRDIRLATAAKQQDRRAVEQLLKEGVDVNARQPDGTTALHWAAHRDDLAVAGLLLRAGAHVNAATDKGVTPLALACENASAAMVEALLKGGANANAAQANGETALMTAARSGNPNVVKALLAAGADVNPATNALGQTALMWAVSERNLDVARTLIESGADVGAQSKSGFTALMFAARQGDVAAARILLAAGADVNQTAHGAMFDKDGRESAKAGTQALALAVAGGRVEMALFLLANGADSNGTARGMTVLHYASSAARSLGGAVGRDTLTRSQRLELVKAILKHGGDPNARRVAIGPFGYGQDPKNGPFDEFTTGVGTRRLATPLFLASEIQRADVDIVRALVEGGADPRLATDDNTTPLMAAAGLGVGTTPPTDEERTRMLAVVKYLVEEARVDVNAANDAGFTALHGAAYTGSNAIIQYLVEHGANLDAQDFKGRTPYRIAQGHAAVTDFHEWPETAELIAKLGANTSLGVDPRIALRGQARDVADRKEP